VIRTVPRVTETDTNPKEGISPKAGLYECLALLKVLAKAG